MRARSVKMSGLLVVVAAFYACGGSGSSSATAPSTTTTTTTATAPSPSVITIVGQSGAQAFTPNPANFGGQQVVFKNSDSIAHHVVLNDGSVDTGDIAPGATSRAVTMPSGGTNYHCSIHPGMIGGIDAAAGDAPPPCTGVYCTGY
jgi:plastocyanin